jgi:replication fork clamp-binding protein CrfC
LTKVPVGDQPKDIENQIRDMILRYITKPNSIILAVTSANTDLANSDGLKLAREVDPSGDRTIGVLTKIDLMDPGTDVMDILSGKIIPLRLGYCAVVNRGQRDIDTNKSISKALEAEKNFFETHIAYRSKSQYLGTPFLAKKLNSVLMHHIRTTMPQTKEKISSALAKYQQDLIELGDPIEESGQDSSTVILNIITEFCNEFRTVLEGNSKDLSSQELSGGARISYVLHETFGGAVKVCDPFDTVKETDIRTILYNSSGSAPALFVATVAFEIIVKQQIKRLEEPSVKCIGIIYDELLRILNYLLQKTTFKRFPTLKEKFYNVVVNYFKKCLVPTTKMATDIISAEACYVNTGHPDFISGHKAINIAQERLAPKQPPMPVQGGSRSAMSTLTQSQLSTIENKEDSGFFGSFFSKSKSKSKRIIDI